MIYARNGLRQKLAKEPKQHNAIIIAEYTQQVDDMFDNCKDHTLLLFWDIINPFSGIAPKIHHVEKALEWADDKENLLVACAAGISRSSAIAYLTTYNETKSIETALSKLDLTVHRPNILILMYGDKILGTDVSSAVANAVALEHKDRPDDDLYIYLENWDNIKKLKLV